MSNALDQILAAGSSNQQEPQGISATDRFISTLKDYDLTQVLPIMENVGNALVVSAAGSGKTTALSFKIGYDFCNGRITPLTDKSVIQPIWLGTFLRSGSEDLRRSIKSIEDNIKFPLSMYMEISTIHAEFYRVCKYLGYSGTVISEPENRAIFKNILRKHKRVSDDEEDRLYTKSQKIRGSLEYDSFLSPIINEVKSVRNAKGLIDFSDMEEYLYQTAVIEERPEIINFLNSRYRRIYLDEFQDVSHIQYEILKVYAKGLGIGSKNRVDDCQNGCIIAIGDDDQSIYSWRGADPSYIIDKFAPDYKANIYHLDVNYRTPENILKAVVPSIVKNRHRLNKNIAAFKKGGMVRYIDNRDYFTAIGALPRLVRDDVISGRSTAVLVRNNSDAISAAVALLSNSISVGLSNIDMTYSGRYGKRIYGLYKLFKGSVSKEALYGLDLVATPKGAQAIRPFISQERHVFWDIEPDDSILNTILPSIKRSYRVLQKAYKVGWDTNSFVTALGYIVDDYMSYKNSNSLRISSVVSSLMYIASISKSFEDFSLRVEMIKQSLYSDLQFPTPQVIVATVHEFKGREADSVYMWDDTDHYSKNEDLEEERRVHYIGCTRAREIETIFTIHGKENRFLKEMDLQKLVR